MAFAMAFAIEFAIEFAMEFAIEFAMEFDPEFDPEFAIERNRVRGSVDIYYLSRTLLEVDSDHGPVYLKVRTTR